MSELSIAYIDRRRKGEMVPNVTTMPVSLVAVSYTHLEKARVMEIVLKDACSVPMEIMEKCCEAIDLIVEFAAKRCV